MKKDPRTVVDITHDHSLSKPNFKPPPQKRQLREFIFSKDKKVSIPKFHWEKDKQDKRDYIYTPQITSQPEYIDLRTHCSLIEQQGLLGSCTGNVIAGAIEFLYKKNNKNTDISRLFIYYYSRFFINTTNYDSGAQLRDAIKSVYKYGAPAEELWPYDISKYKDKPSQIAHNDANNRKVTLYERIENHEGCLAALAEGYPVSVGFYVYSSFESDEVKRTGIMPYPSVSYEKCLGGHAVLLVGYDKSRQVYIARNSWGKEWGDKGYFYMPFRVIQNNKMSDDFWVIKSVNVI